MADESNQQESGAEPRVYKASGVHKRKATKPLRSKARPASSSQPPQASAQPRERTRFQMPEDPDASRPREPETPTGVQEQDPPAPPVANEQPDQADNGEAPRPRTKLWVRILKIFGTAAAAILLVAIGYFSADRWLIHNDSLSMLGEWYAAGTTVPVVISDSTIKLNADTTYEYTIDPVAKTMTYRFGEKEGQGRYWFSADRKCLVITDGSFNMWTTLFDDILHGLRDAFDNAFGGGATLPSGDGVIALVKA